MSERAAELEQALERLEADGARGYDAPGCDCVRSLLVRAEALEAGARARLLDRAAHHLARLEARYTRDRERAARRLERLQNMGVSTEGHLRRSLERGDLTRIHRTARRVSVAPARHSMVVPAQGSDVPTGDARMRRRRSALAYEDSMAELVASFALARSMEAIPQDAGPYNSRLIAHRTLDTMRRLSPLYLRTQLERLDDLGNLLQLPPLAPPAPVKRKPARRKPAKRKPS